MPYLRAAIDLRAGVPPTQVSPQGHELRAGEIDAAGACRMLGAAQRMRVPAAELKPLREAVEHALANLNRIPLPNLLSLAEFFWRFGTNATEVSGLSEARQQIPASPVRSLGSAT